MILRRINECVRTQNCFAVFLHLVVAETGVRVGIEPAK
jgi:hypothetical protein